MGKNDPQPTKPTDPAPVPDTTNPFHQPSDNPNGTSGS